MPAVSRAQQQYMAIAEHDPSKLKGKRPNMTQKQLHDFAATPTQSLPEHVADKPKRNSLRRRTK